MLTDNQGRPATLVGTGPVSAYLARLSPRSRRTYLGDARVIAVCLWDIPSPRTESELDGLGWSGLGVAEGVNLCGVLAASYAPSTARRMLACYRGIMRECWRQGRISAEALARALDLPAVKGSTVSKGRALTWVEVERLIASAVTPRAKAMLAVMAGAGLRRAEVAALRHFDVKRRAGRLELLVQGKGRRQRRVALPGWAAGRLEHFLVQTGPRQPESLLFGMSDGFVADVVRRTAERAGLGVVSAHDLRRTYASLALGAGMPLASLSRAMGHANVKTTMVYDRRPDEDVLAEAGRLDNGLGPK